MKIAVITCYRDSDYIRATTLRLALQSIPYHEVQIVKNNHRGLLRYPEVLLKVLQVKKSFNPDVFLLTFRGQELLPFMLKIAGQIPLIFDEFIVPLAWATQENRQKTLINRFKQFLATKSLPHYKKWLQSCRIILSDTDEHAKKSSELSGIPISTYQTIPVGTDESVFSPKINTPKKRKKLEVFFYGGMYPLHGLDFILQTALLLKDHPIHFTIAGGSKQAERKIRDSIKNGAIISYLPYIEFKKLPKFIQAADVCLGGPFGDTPQAQDVITGKTYQFMASAKPVIIGKSHTTAIFRDKLNCLIANQADSQSLANTILWGYEHQYDLHKIGINGYKYYMNNFSVLQIAKKLTSVLKSL